MSAVRFRPQPFHSRLVLSVGHSVVNLRLTMKNKALQKLDVAKLGGTNFLEPVARHRGLLGQRRAQNSCSKPKRVMTEEEYETAKTFADSELKQREERGAYNGATIARSRGYVASRVPSVQVDAQYIRRVPLNI